MTQSNTPQTKRNLNIYLNKKGWNKVKMPNSKPDHKPLSYTELIIKYKLSSWWLQKIVKRLEKRLSTRKAITEWKNEPNKKNT